MRGGLEASRPRASPATDVTGHSTEVLDVDAAPDSEILAGFLAEYGSGSEDADRSHPDEGPDVIDVDQEASQAADSRMKELQKKWTAHVKKTQQTTFCRTFLSCRTKNVLVRICSALASMIKILPQWDDAELSHLVVPEVEYPSDGEEEEGEKEEEEEEEDQRGGGGSATDMSHLVDPDPDYPSDSEEEEGEEEEEEEQQQQPPIDDTPRKKSRR
jgi:hypothetical protein